MTTRIVQHDLGGVETHEDGGYVDVVLAPLTRVHCPRPGCTYAASGHSEPAAIGVLATHLVAAHMQEHLEASS